MRKILILCLLAWASVGCSQAQPGTSDSAADVGEPADTTAIDGIDAEDTGGPDTGVALDTMAPDAVEKETDAGVEVDPTEAMFEADRLLDVEITLPPEDWDALRLQTRTILDLFGVGCMEGPFESPFTYFQGEVRIDGELVEKVGIRKKGFLGSLSENRPSLKVKFGEYVEDQAFEGMRRLTLNNSRQDPSKLRQCISYDLFRKAGLVAPRCNWAKVTVNGNYLGLYVHVESLKKPFVRRNFTSDKGTLWEGTLSDFRQGWTKTFEQKTNKGEDDNAGLVAIQEALSAPDDVLFDTLNAHMDVEKFIDFWAMEVLIGHWDGYAGNTNNFYLYEDPTDGHRVTFIPWGADGTLTLPLDEEGKFIEGALHSVNLTGALVKRLYQVPEIRFYYYQRMQHLLDTVWSAQPLLDDIEKRTAFLLPHLESWLTEWHAWSLGTLNDFVKQKRALVQAEIDVGGPNVDPPLRDPFCMHPIGAMEGSYTTSWGTLHLGKHFETGSGSFGGVVNDESLSFTMVGASADEGQGEDEGIATVGIFGIRNGDEMTFLILQTPIERFVSGATLRFEDEEAWGTLLYMKIGVDVEPQYVGSMVMGAWTIDDAGLAPGEAVSGSVSGDLLKWGK